MDDRKWNLVLGVALVFMVLAVASASLAQPSTVQEATYPRFVADSPASGSWIPCWNTAGTDTLRGVGLLEVRAYTETKFSCWYHRPTKVPHKVKWPVYGPAASDTTYYVGAGQTLTFRFPKPWVQYLLVKEGDAIFQGE